MYSQVILKAGKERSLNQRHPWVFSGAVQDIKGVERNGETVQVLSANGEWLASGAYSIDSQIRIRIWSFDQEEEIAGIFFKRRIERAINARKGLLADKEFSACRIVNSESDGLPGLVIDKYGDFFVCQFLSAGVELWKDEIIRQIESLLPTKGIYERSDTASRIKEGLDSHAGLLLGEEPPPLIDIREGGIRFLVDIRHGQKTGFYLDQRENRSLVAGYACGADVLNCFSYTGGFGLWALKEGAASLTNIDTSTDALELARKNVELNGFDANLVENVAGDVFSVLRRYRDARRQFDLIILDPPKFVESIRQIPKGSRGYKDINLLALKLLRPGGILFTFSCSGHVKQDLFQKIVASAALDSGRDACIIKGLGQASDHPVSLYFPEGGYLKGFICRVC
ncbi:MAG: class I SAM-dependent methyltransferase [Pseudomonadota bacterium]